MARGNIVFNLKISIGQWEVVNIQVRVFRGLTFRVLWEAIIWFLQLKHCFSGFRGKVKSSRTVERVITIYRKGLLDAQ